DARADPALLRAAFHMARLLAISLLLPRLPDQLLYRRHAPSSISNVSFPNDWAREAPNRTCQHFLLGCGRYGENQRIHRPPSRGSWAEVVLCFATAAFKPGPKRMSALFGLPPTVRVRGPYTCALPRSTVLG